MGAMVYSPDGAFAVSADEFVAAALTRWPDAHVLRSDNSHCDVTVQIPAEDGSLWQIFHSPEGEQVWTDGNAEQELVFAQWARALVRDDAPGRILLLNHDYTLAAELAPGMSTTNIRDAWTEQPPE